MKDRATNALEAAFDKLFLYNDNSPETYQGSNTYHEALKSYAFSPLVKLHRNTKERLDLLLRLGEYIYGMEGKPDKALYPFEMAVDLASRLYPTLSGSPELA
jgi:hypothetical protein